MIETLAASRHRRQRRAAEQWKVLPTLTGSRLGLLMRWARSDAPARRWSTLQTLAGAGSIEAAEALLALLLEVGCVQVDEQFHAGRWWPQQVKWVDLARLQQALGLQSLVERDAAREQTVQALEEIAERNPVLRDAALTLQAARLSAALVTARTELLKALASWIVDQRSGVRQDFALHARPHTKAITEAEWSWLGSELDLGSLGIERFAPVLWLAGPMALASVQGTASLRPWPFVGLPVEALEAITRIDNPPEAYWVIENRASFERQARKRKPGQCVIWVPGRPSSAWQAAVARLLSYAPAPAWVSADADPAGIEIALTVGAVWSDRGLEWTPHMMEPARLIAGKTLPLNDYDQASLQRIGGRQDMPVELRELASEIAKLGRKAEQEGWL